MNAIVKPVRLQLSRKKGFDLSDALVSELRSAFGYDPSAGIVVWRNALPKSKARVGEEAGCLDKYGYRIATYRGRHYRVHQLAWFLHYGEWPRSGIDHIDGNPSNNRIGNLRLANQQQNGFNRKAPKTNKSGVKGVYWNKQRRRWQAQLTINGKVSNLGRFKSLEEAAETVRRARLIHHGEFSRHD